VTVMRCASPRPCDDGDLTHGNIVHEFGPTYCREWLVVDPGERLHPQTGRESVLLLEITTPDHSQFGKAIEFHRDAKHTLHVPEAVS